VSTIIKEADVIISGVGKPGLITGAMIKDGAIVIDGGTVFQGKKIVGDIDSESVSEKASYIAPVPGGIGPLTVACLLENLLKLISVEMGPNVVPQVELS
jgi:methylenetetrahydrofolate dehydrogenase (NADP+)/methenyltetrahydrofolate cyclohydrolase